MPDAPESFRPAVESLLPYEWLDGRKVLGAAVEHLSGGGKAIRARCVTMVHEALGGGGGPRIAEFSRAVELLHLGSLIHDDMLDEADLRRDRPTVHVAFGSKVAVLAGDVAVSRAGRLIAELDRTVLSRKFAQVLEELCEGELVQDDHRWNPAVTLEAYLDRISLKTGGLFELACEGAAVLADAPPDTCEAAAAFGRSLGCLFQIVDDLLDTGAASSEVGKPTGRDLSDGLLTLQTVLALSEPDLATGIQAAIEQHRDPAANLQHPALQARAKDVMESVTRETLGHLARFPATPGKEQIASLVEDLANKGLEALSNSQAGVPAR